MFRKIVAAIVLVLALVVPAAAITDTGRPAVTRLWMAAEGDEQFVCTASYIFPYVGEGVSWIITAAHCMIGDLIKRNADETMIGVVSWKASLRDYGNYTKQVTDIAIGIVPDVRDVRYVKREHLWLANDDPTSGDRVYIHGFPMGIEKVSLGYVVDQAWMADIEVLVNSDIDGYPSLERKKLLEVLPMKLALLVPAGEITGGSSGSPILNKEGRLVGILWGDIKGKDPAVLSGIPAGYDLVLFTPISRITEMMKLMDIK